MTRSATQAADQIPKVSAVLVTHGHGDHLGDAVEIAQRDGAPALFAKGVMEQGGKAVILKPGGTMEF